MTPFLKNIARQIFEKHKDDMKNVHILVPNRRAILYLKYYLSELSEQPLWTPEMYSIEDFIFKITGFQKCETIDLLFELYAIHQNIADDDARNFDNFASWGEQLLSDFNDIDFYLADADALFSYLSDAKAIERWHIDGSELTDNEKNYLKFYRLLATYYHLLKEKMQMEKKGWTGFVFRLFVENFDRFFTSFSEKPFYLIGFNALSKAEEEIFKNIRKNASTTIFWDADEYYLNNPLHEAGHFLRNHATTFGMPMTPEQNFKQPKKITISGIAKNIGQMMAAGDILNQIPEISNAPDDTALILNDERLLLPLLDFIPEKFKKFNVTMGYPLHHALPCNFIISWLQMHVSATISLKNKPYFDKKLVFDFFQHPFVKEFFSTKPTGEVRTLEKNIRNYYKSANSLRMSIHEIEHDFFAELPALFAEIGFAFKSFGSDNQGAIEKIEQMIALLRSLLTEKNDLINLEFLFHLSKVINRLYEINEKYAGALTLQSILFIIKRFIRNVKVPFSGEPIGGLQMMGMLETRLLDYKNIILLSVNEGIMPSKKQNATFIPFDIRRSFSLPTHYEDHAVSAYHFYRLLERAENIHILYNNDSGSGVGAKEQSRFIIQILQEIPKYNPDIEIIIKNNEVEAADFSASDPLVIQKTKFAMRRLNEMAQKGFSPSAINDYLRCPVDFYLKRIAKIPDSLEFIDAVDSATFGTIIHETIYKAHEHLVGKQLIESDIDSIFHTYKTVLEDSFKKNWAGGDYHKGKNLLTYIVAQDYLQSFLQKERDEIIKANAQKSPYVILLQEKEVSATIEIASPALRTYDSQERKSGITVLLKGVIDRVEKIGDTIRVVDFKTGMVQKSELNINDIERFKKEKYVPKAIQLLMYAWLIQQSGQISSSAILTAGIVSFRQISNGFLPLSISGNELINSDTLQLTTDILTDILEEIFDPEIDFEPSKEPDAHIYSQFEMLYN